MVFVIQSMTGFGRYEETVNGRRILVEIKSVNHRFFEFSCRVGRDYGFLEEKLKTFLQQYLTRGKVDVYVSIASLESSSVGVQINHAAAAGYVAALRELSKTYGLSDVITPGEVARFGDVCVLCREPEDENVLWDAVRPVAEKALQALLSMRAAEGEKLSVSLQGHARRILELVEKVEARSPETVRAYEERLRAKLEEVLEGQNIDESRIVTEAAIFADKVAVEEETVRLRSHVAQFLEMLKETQPVGRKLDFLIQEMNREANTIGSKCMDSQIAYVVVDMKAEIEKLREQIQNIE